VHIVRNAEYRTETDYTMSLDARALDRSQFRSLDLLLISGTVRRWLTARQRSGAPPGLGERRSWWSWKLFLNGYLDPRFSVRIREGFPRMPLDRGGAGVTR
jgi:hypothetical protein